MVKEKRYACATERFSQRTLSPLCCISFRFWSEGASWRNIMAIKLVKSHACLFCNAILWVLWKGILGIKWSHTPYLKLLFSMISLAYCAHSFLHCFFFFLFYSWVLDSDWSGLCHYYCLFIMERNKELVPVHSTEDHFMSDTKWDRDCCSATVSELPMAWTVFKPHQVQRKEIISWYMLDYALAILSHINLDDN